MSYKDKEQRRRYNREYARLRRAGQPTGSRGIEVIHPSNSEQTRTAQGLLRILGQLIGDVITCGEGDTLTRARAAGYLISIGLRAVETADLDARLTDLENKILLGGHK